MDNRIAKTAVQLAQAVAQRTEVVSEAEHEVRFTSRLLERFELAYKEDAVSELELDQARKEAQSAQLQLDQARCQQTEARLQLELETARLEAHNIRSLFDGQVVEITAKVGQSLRRSDPVLTIVDMATFRVELHLPVRWYSRLAVGDQFLLRASEPVNDNVTATLIAVDLRINAPTRTMRFVFTIDNRTLKCPAGYTVTFVGPAPQATASVMSKAESRQRADGS